MCSAGTFLTLSLASLVPASSDHLQSQLLSWDNILMKALSYRIDGCWFFHSVTRMTHPLCLIALSRGVFCSSAC